MNRIRVLMIVTLSSFIENVYYRYIILLAQWYTKLCHLAEYTGYRPDTPMCIVIHSGQFIPNQFVPEILVLCLVRPHLFVIHYWFLFFSKNLFFSLAPMTNATPAFPTLWFNKSIVNFSSLSWPFPNWQILESSKLKEFADNDFEVDENGRKFPKWIENTTAKGEIAFLKLVWESAKISRVKNMSVFPSVLFEDIHYNELLESFNIVLE